MIDDKNNKMFELQQQITQLDIEDWLTHDVFSNEWWYVVAIFIIPYIIFWKLVKKDRLSELVLFVCIIMILTEALDHIGYELGLWFYPVVCRNTKYGSPKSETDQVRIIDKRLSTSTTKKWPLA